MQAAHFLVEVGHAGRDARQFSIALIGFRGGRYYFTVPGLAGGGDGPNGKLVINGEVAVGGGDASVPPGGTMTCFIPGGGGMGDPTQRSRKLVQRDIAYGYVSRAEAVRLYGWSESTPVTSTIE